VTATSPLQDAAHFRALCQQIACPTVVIVGDDDAVTAPAQGQALAEVTGGSLAAIQGGGHAPTSATRSWSTACCAGSSTG
jgi:pimeloyl-ACP methyl ester carboxylesterase